MHATMNDNNSNNILFSSCETANAINEEGIRLMKENRLDEAIDAFMSAMMMLSTCPSMQPPTPTHGHASSSPGYCTTASGLVQLNQMSSNNTHAIMATANQFSQIGRRVVFSNALGGGDYHYYNTVSASSAFTNRCGSFANKTDTASFVAFQRPLSVSPSAVRNVNDLFVILSSVVLFNSALANQLQALEPGRSYEDSRRLLSRALQLYGLAKHALKEIKDYSFESSMHWASVAVLFLAISNNRGQLAEDLFMHEEAQACKAEVCLGLSTLSPVQDHFCATTTCPLFITQEEVEVFFASASMPLQETSSSVTGAAAA